MKYLIYDTVADMKERNRMLREQQPGVEAKSTDSTIYWANMIISPVYNNAGQIVYNGPEGVLELTDSDAATYFNATEQARMYDTKAQVLNALTS